VRLRGVAKVGCCCVVVAVVQYAGWVGGLVVDVGRGVEDRTGGLLKGREWE
jgi:hypothetical protein